MNVWDWVTSPLIWFGGVLVILGYFEYRVWRKREDALLALCRKYRLHMSTGWGSEPDPDIRGWIFPATYPKYLEGRIGGVPVVAFDYLIGMGRGKRLGSGVGVKRQVLNADKIARGMKATHREGWTFVYTTNYGLRARRMLSADEFERMWTMLLSMTARESAVTMRPPESVEEVHIRPRRGGVERQCRLAGRRIGRFGAASSQLMPHEAAL